MYLEMMLLESNATVRALEAADDGRLIYTHCGLVENWVKGEEKG